MNKRLLYALAVTMLAAMAVNAVLANADNQPAAAADNANVTTLNVPIAQSAFFCETFNDENLDWTTRWIASGNEKYSGQWNVETGSIASGLPGDLGLLAKSAARHHAMLATFPQTLTPSDDQPLVIQYEVRFNQPHECGGAYIKLISESDEFSAKTFHDQTPYTIMFGPDKCGATDKVHFIFRHRNPITNVFEEKHLLDAPNVLNNRLTHLYTLIVRPDNSFSILVDQLQVRNGSLLTDFRPTVNPPREIDDPADKKPADWVDEEMMADPTDFKPEDWNEDEPRLIADPNDSQPDNWYTNEPEYIADPAAQKPVDWDDESDGDFEAPLIKNPKCEASGCGEWKPRMIPNPAFKGKWKPKMITNPDYKGVWAPRKIPNPNFFEDLHPARFNKMAALGIEIWSMQNDIEFDNFFIGFDEQEAQAFANRTFAIKQKAEKKVEEDLLQTTLDAEKTYLTRALDVAAKYPLASALTVAALLISTLLLCLFVPSSSSAPAPVVPASPVAADNDASSSSSSSSSSSEGVSSSSSDIPAASSSSSSSSGPRSRKTPKDN